MFLRRVVVFYLWHLRGRRGLFQNCGGITVLIFTFNLLANFRGKIWLFLSPASVSIDNPSIDALLNIVEKGS
jgi:hypothetical protein